MSGRLPEWFKQKVPSVETMTATRKLLGDLGLHTICESAHCPNIGQCFSKKTATFLILGSVCSRNCTFCAVEKGKPSPVDSEEPQHLLEAAQKLGLHYIVITSVTRDDLPDGGATQFARIIRALKDNMKEVIIEVLIPDFQGSIESLKIVAEAMPHVINHNVETIPRLYPEVRPMANYDRSVELLMNVKKINPKIISKAGIMLGLGETNDEVVEVMQDLREAECDLLTIGQYLQPSPQHHPIIRFVPPEEFSSYVEIGKNMGFADVASAPLVRSSFEAGALYAKLGS